MSTFRKAEVAKRRSIRPVATQTDAERHFSGCKKEKAASLLLAAFFDVSLIACRTDNKRFRS
jgi:hypothetical protein